jgi:hypothetical protein
MTADLTTEVVVDIVNAAVDDLADLGCSPLDCAAALITTGLRELDTSDAPPAELLAFHRMVLEHVLGALKALQARVPAAATRH